MIRLGRFKLGHRSGWVVVTSIKGSLISGYSEGSDRACGDGPFQVGIRCFRAWLRPSPGR